MIFVTVGASRPFDRLIVEIDRIAVQLLDDVFAQIGHGHYEPRNIEYQRFLPEHQMDECVQKANLVITHGGFGTMFKALSNKKCVIAVPRSMEETDGDQTSLVKLLESEGRLAGVYDLARLKESILNFNLVPRRFTYNLKLSEDIDMHIKRWFPNKV